MRLHAHRVAEPLNQRIAISTHHHLPGRLAKRVVRIRKVTDEQPYEVLSTYENFEVRRYPAHLVAEVEVQGSFDSAGNTAFSDLFGYISGDNESSASIAMTSPVVQQAVASESIAMTSPVVQTATADGTFAVAFVLPETMTLDSAPTPTNPEVQVREVPERVAAAVTYAGYDSEELHAKHRTDLLAALAAEGLTTDGPPMAARFDAPRTPGPQRRNEVVQPIATPTDGSIMVGLGWSAAGDGWHA